MLNRYPFAQKILQPFSKQTWAEISDRSWVLCPEETCASSPAVYLPSDLEKIQATHAFSKIETELNTIQGKPTHHIATVAYRVRQATIAGDRVYKKGFRYPLALDPHPPLQLKTEAQQIQSAAIACTELGNRWFGDWMTYDLPLTLAAQRVAAPITIQRPLYTDERYYRQLFQLFSPAVSHIHCNELFFIDDRGQNRYKRERYQRLRSIVKNAFPASNHTRVMIKRNSNDEARSLANADAVEQFLQSEGFVILDPAQLSVEELLRQVAGAKILAGVEGSHLVHGIYALADDATILTFQPPLRFNSFYKHSTDCIGMKFAFTVGDAVNDGFTIDLTSLAQVLDRIEAQSTASMAVPTITHHSRIQSCSI